MSIVAVFSGTYCDADEVAEAVAKRLGYELICEDAFLEETSKRRRVPVEKLARALQEPPSFFNKLTRAKEQSIAIIRLALAERIKQDQAVYHGFALHLLPREIAHVLRVCVIANQSHRINVAMQAKGLSEAEARRAIRKDDKKRFEWVQYLLDREPYDESLYDVTIPMQAHSVESAAEAIVKNALKEAVKTTPQSQLAVEDRLLAARVNLFLVEKGHDVEVSCCGGKVTLEINKYVIRMEHHKKELSRIAGAVPGVKQVQVKIGPRFQAPAIYGNIDFELPRKILLVDDEKEFVQTLSERLQARDIPSTMAYNGEDALAQAEKDEPEVMILDLKMPGINGMDVLRRLKQERPKVEVIILTGHGSEKDRALAAELGAFAYLEKPVNIDLLTQTMKEAYRKISEQRAVEEPNQNEQES